MGYDLCAKSRIETTGLDMLFLKLAPSARHLSWRRASTLVAVCVIAASFGLQPAAFAANKGRQSPRPENLDDNSLLGSYLAGHVARSSRDSDNAALYYRRALSKDPGNQDILDEAFQLEHLRVLTAREA
jgi:hypothetical protein